MFVLLAAAVQVLLMRLTALAQVCGTCHTFFGPRL
jgi:hypothetical protein